LEEVSFNTDSQLHRDAELLRSIRPLLKLINGIEPVKTDFSATEMVNKLRQNDG